MDKCWISNPNRLSSEYVNGVDEFITFVRRNLDVKCLKKCSCNRCLNREMHHIDYVRYHLLMYEFLNNYIQLHEHGEQSIPQVLIGSSV